MEADELTPAGSPQEYVSTRIESRAARHEAGADRSTADAGDDADDAEDAHDAENVKRFIETGVFPYAAPPETRSVEERFGLALLRLRLYRGWSQAQLGRLSKVDQSIISRLERGTLPGLAIRRVYDLLRALRADEITFGPGARPPQSSWETAMYGDIWERAGRVAERRLSRRRSA